MNDTEMEKWLAERFRAAPNPEPSERLQQVVDADRIRASIPRRWAMPSRALGLSGRRPVLAGLVGLAATAILAAGLLTVVASRLTQTPAAPGGGIEWQPSTQVSGFAFTFGPYLASADGRLYMVGSINGLGGSSSTEVWSSADGASWERVSQPGTFEKYGPGFFPQGFSGDGQGGLVIVGGVAGGPAWHSSDGRTWTSAQFETPALARMAAVAARPGAIVAIGDRQVPIPDSATMSGQTANQMYAWFSAEGNAWSQVVLPDSLGYVPRAITAWKGGFAAVADKEVAADWASSVWTSADGRTWEKAPQELAFSPIAIVALGDRVVTVGARLDSELGMVPASWSSTDGRKWTESTASVRDRATMFDDVAVVGDTLVAIGSSHMYTTDVAGGPASTTPPMPPESVWISSDGATWRLLAEDSSLNFGFLNTHVASLGGRVVIATQRASAVEVFLGDLVP